MGNGIKECKQTDDTNPEYEFKEHLPRRDQGLGRRNQRNDDEIHDVKEYRESIARLEDLRGNFPEDLVRSSAPIVHVDISRWN